AHRVVVGVRRDEVEPVVAVEVPYRDGLDAAACGVRRRSLERAVSVAEEHVDGDVRRAGQVGLVIRVEVADGESKDASSEVLWSSESAVSAAEKNDDLTDARQGDVELVIAVEVVHYDREEVEVDLGGRWRLKRPVAVADQQEDLSILVRRNEIERVIVV